ncbi:hypothetical protein NG99_27060, partial [Erwinia typographi]
QIYVQAPMKRFCRFATSSYATFCLVCAPISGASVEYVGTTTISASKSDITWPTSTVSAVSEESIWKSIGARQLSSPPWKKGSFEVKLEVSGASACRLTADNIRISISTFTDRTPRFSIADNKLDINDTTGKNVTFTVEEVNKVGKWIDTYYWYLKEFEISNVKVACGAVDDSVDKPTVKLNVNGQTVGLTGSAVINTTRGSTDVPQLVRVASYPGQCQELGLWKPPVGNMAVDVTGPETIDLKADREGVPPMRAVRKEGGVYSLCANNDPGAFSGSAEIRIRPQ